MSFLIIGQFFTSHLFFSPNLNNFRKLFMMNKILNKHLQFLSLSLIVGLFFISSIMLLKLNNSLVSLRFIGDDLEEILDNSGQVRQKPSYFYQSPKTLVYDLKNTNIDHVFKDFESNVFFEELPETMITFSNQEVKKKFYQLLRNQSSSEKLDQIKLKTQSTVVKGKVCFINNCSDEYIAFKKRI